jgi:hypothetical protein
MLYLNPPYYVIDGVSLLPDHADELQYYFMPLAPHLTTIEDAQTKQQIPQIQVIRFAGETATGGFLNFDCNLGISDDRLAEIGAELRSKANLKDDPKLAPVPVIDGSVRMMLFGKESASPDDRKPPAGGGPATTPAGPQFVLKINNAAKPSLYGDNQAAFSVQLDPEGVTILDAALRGEMSPIGVVYSLQYVGLRPAYHVHVSADWDRVQTHLSDHFGVNTIFFSFESDKVIDKLVEDRVIVIEADKFVAEGEPGGDDVAGRYEQALNEVREMVGETFFEPSIEPMSEGGGFLDTLKRTSQLAATGGMGSLFTMKKVDLTRIDQKSLNVDMSERTAVLRSIYPQGHLAGLTRIIEQQHLDMSRFTLSVSLDDDFFKKRKVRVISRAEYDVDQIASMNVSLTYEGDTKNVVLDPTTPEKEIEWMSVLDGTEMKRDVSVSYEVGFKSSLGPGRPAGLKSKPEVVTGDAIEISPRVDALYSVMPVPINAAAFPWDVYPTVELDAEYVDELNHVHISDHWVLTDQSMPGGQGSWPVFLVDDSHRTIRYRLRYHGADGREMDGEWIESDEGLIRVADPYPRRRSVTIVAPSAMFQTVERAFVDVSYIDEPNNVSKQQSLEFNAQAPGSQTFFVELVDPKKRQVAFKVTLVFTDGHTVEVPPSFTMTERIVLRPDMRGHRAVAVRPEPIDFAPKGLREIFVEAKYEDVAAALSFSDSFSLTAPSDERSFEYDYVDAANDGYQYRVTHKYTNGLKKATQWQNSDAPELVVSVQ